MFCASSATICFQYLDLKTPPTYLLQKLILQLAYLLGLIFLLIPRKVGSLPLWLLTVGVVQSKPQAQGYEYSEPRVS